MALVGTFVDIVRSSFAAPGGLAFTTLQHSLGAAPNIVIPVMVSAASATTGHVSLMALKGNASLATIGYAGAASSPDTVYDAVCWKIHSLIS